MSVLFEASDIAVYAGTAMLVHPVSLTIGAGRALTILGETGSGKSLLAQAVIGTLPRGLAARGQVRMGDLTLDPARPEGFRPLWGRSLGVLPQEPWLALDPLMPAAAQVAEVHALTAGLPWGQARQAAARDLARLGLSQAGARRPDQLSGGMAQRVAFAAARAGGARITIADEPTKGLDADRRDAVGDLLQAGLAQGGGLLTITHDLALARQLGGDLIVMLGGRVVERGPTGAVLAAPAHAYTRALIEADPARWPRPPSRPAQGAPVLQASGLTGARGGRVLFRDLDLTLHPGRILGVTGPSGCGKSTLGDMMLGLAAPMAGRVRRAPGLAATRFQKLYQDPPSAFPRTVPLGRALDDLVARHRLDGGRIAPLLDRLQLHPALLGRRPSEVSGGELQRLALLRVLLLDPVFLFADEPTSRLDPITQAQVVRLMVEIARETGTALVVVSHDAALIARTCDGVVALDDAVRRAA